MAINLLTIKSVEEYLLKPEIYGYLDELGKKYSLSEERLEELLDLTDAVISGAIPVEEMPHFMQEAFDMPEDQALKLAVDLAGYRLLPLADFLPNVQVFIEQNGGKLEDYPKERVERERFDAETIAKKIVEARGLTMPESLLQRFMMLIRAYIDGQRDREATKIMLTRNQNIGGMELAAEVAENVVAEIDRRRADHEKHLSELQPEVKEVFENREKKQEVTEQEHSKEQESSKKQKTRDKQENSKEQILNSKEESKESQKKQPQAAPPPVTPPPVPKTSKPKATEEALPENLPVAAETHALAKEVPVISGDVFGAEPEENSKGQKTSSKAKEENVKDQTPKAQKDDAKKEEKEPAKLEKSSKRVAPPVPKPMPKVSAVSAEKTEKAKPVVEPEVDEALKPLHAIFTSKKIPQKTFAEVVQGHVRGLRDPLRTEALLKEKYAFNADELDQAMSVLEEARKAAQGYRSTPVKQESTLKKKDTDAQNIFEKEQDVLNSRHAAMTKKVAALSAPPALPHARVSAARTKEEELEHQRAKVDPEKLKQAQTASKPEKAKAKLSQPSQPPASSGKVTDVKYTQKLVGPVQELGAMTLGEFRRLSSDPTEAVRKILDKLSLLESTSYEERIAGVKAWRVSPVNRLYLQMTQESLAKGQSIQEISAGRRNAGEESLSPAEIHAIVKLNDKMRF